MECPACKTTLAMTHRQGIEIDYCPQCRGVWLDRGELDKIVEREAGDLAPTQPAGGPPPGGAYGAGYREPRQHGDYRYGHGHHKKKKSLLGELFDF